MTYSFERMSEGGLIIVSVTLDNKSKLRMILDTGCSTTTVDSNALYLSGYELLAVIYTQKTYDNINRKTSLLQKAN